MDPRKIALLLKIKRITKINFSESILSSLCVENFLSTYVSNTAGTPKMGGQPILPSNANV
jgi:hypothetical protein